MESDGHRSGTALPRSAGAPRAALAALLLLAWPAVADAEGWRLRKQADGVVVHTRPAPGWSLEEFRGVTEVRAPLRALVEMLMDVDRFPAWMHDCSEARSLQRSGIRQGSVYSVTNAPWPVRDRDVVMRWTLDQDDETGVVTLRMQSDAAAMPPRKGHVRIPRAHGLYRLAPRPDGTVQVTYQFQSESGGRLPAWLAGSWVVAMPYHTLRNLRSFVGQHGYTGRGAEFRTIREPER